MSTFEFISVLFSIVVGLGLTRLLTGVARALKIRRKLHFYWVQGVWVLNLGLLFVSFWWATRFGHADRETWLYPSERWAFQQNRGPRIVGVRQF